LTPKNETDVIIPEDQPRLSDVERAKANERFKETAVDFRKDEASFDLNIKNLEPLAEKLNETQKKILNVILSDWSAENTIEAERDIFLKLRNACGRAGMLENKNDQITFFKTLADPQFMNIVKTVGQGLISIHIVPIVAKVIQQAIEGDKTSQRWALEISGVMPGKFDFYLNRYQLNHQVTNIGEINFDGKTDAELSEMVGDLAEVVG